MNLNKLTQKSMEALQYAESTAVKNGNVEIDLEHLILALLDQQDGLLPKLFNKMDISPDIFKKEIAAIIEKKPKVSGPGKEAGKIYISRTVDTALTKAEDEAKRLKDEYISVEHIFLGIIEVVKNT